MNAAIDTSDLIRAARRAGLGLAADGDKLIVSGSADIRQAWRERLREHKAAILAALAAETLPPEVEARIAHLLVIGYIDQAEADQVLAGWHRYPAEWEFLLTCCESAAGITEMRQ